VCASKSTTQAEIEIEKNRYNKTMGTLAQAAPMQKNRRRKDRQQHDAANPGA
jgi:hypothetical protein